MERRWRTRWSGATVVAVVLAGASVVLPRPATAAPVVGGQEPWLVAVHAGPDDAFTHRPATSYHGWQYIPYERTYRGLPVVGGDFVVVVDPNGRVDSTSVAQRASIHGLDTHPTLTRAAAERVARGRSAGTVSGTRLVVDAKGDTPRLAWETVVTDAGGPSVRSVDVDAATGAVLHTQEHVVHDIGHAALNGGAVNVPDTLINCPTGDCPNQHTWILAYPAGGGMSCDAPTVHRTDPEPLDWGNGDPTNAETACVDAMFDSATENSMLSHWLGRGGLDGGGADDGFPIFTGSTLLNDTYYVTRSAVNGPEVHIGHSPNGVWWASLDIVGHENGHGVDDSTPGGMSGGGTPEFIADAFGVATEWYANEHAPYDTPDYVLGDTPALALPSSLKRFMYDPHLSGSGVDCWTTGTPALDAHNAAGVGDHWFYLMAEGSAPNDGQPVSPTCNGQPVAGGLGVQATIQILYNAMLMKSSNSSYLTYRTWTLTAAKNLFPGNCALLDIVRRAWDGVGVPQQPGDPVCVPGLTGLSQAAAQSTLATDTLMTGTVTQQASLSPVGTVIAQDPAPGAFLKPGGAVNLTVSAGGVRVPNVLSYDRASAISIVQGAGLSVTTSSQLACINPGEVLMESPDGGAVVLPGSSVHLTVDSGTIKSCKIIK